MQYYGYYLIDIGNPHSIYFSKLVTGPNGDNYSLLDLIIRSGSVSAKPRAVAT